MKCCKNKENCGGPLTPATVSLKSKLFICGECYNIFRALVRKGNKAALAIDKELKTFQKEMSRKQNKG